MKNDIHYFTMSIENSLFRSMKSFCGKNGLTLRHFCNEALALHLSAKENEAVDKSIKTLNSSLGCQDERF